MMRVLDLFSGIGGFSLGLERTGGFRTVAFCEIDPFCRRVLAKHWPKVPCYHDVNMLTKDQLDADGISVDVICGGFPCQDISNAGLQAGIRADRSGLWFQYARIISEIRPRFVIVENVAALLARGMGDVLGTLAEIGYDAEWSVISACAMGSPQTRERVWIVAYPMCERLEGLHDARQRIHMQSASQYFRWDWQAQPDVYRKSDGFPNAMDAIKSLGNAVVPQIPELIGRAIMEAEPLPQGNLFG